MLKRRRESRHIEQGDTLIELLVALVIVGLAVVALLGGLMTSTATSSTHRSLVTLDSALRAFGTSLQSAVSNQLGGASSTVVAYQPCASTYQFAGPMYPETQSVGGYVSIPAMGFAATQAITATIGASTVSAGTSSSSGGVVATFPVPTLATGTYAVSLSDGTSNISAGTLTVASAGNPDALAGQYSLTTQVTSIGIGPCASGHLQQVVLTLANTQVNAGAADTVTVFLADNRNIAVPTEVVSGPSSPQTLGSTLTFTATLTRSGTTPTGSVTWTFPNSPSGTTCAGGSTTTSLSGGSASCTVGTAGSPPVAGTYTAVAVYSGDSNYAGTSAESSQITVTPGTATVTTSTTTSSPAQIGSTLNFSATVAGVAGITPTGSIVWTWPGAPAGATCTAGNTTTLSAGTASCSVTPALLGTYKPTATYQADSSSSYSSGATGNQASVTVSIAASSSTAVTPTGTTSATTGSNITFTATVTGTVSGLPTPTGQVKWTFQSGAPSGAACSGGNITTLSSGTTTCVVSAAIAGTYNPTAAYQGDTNFAGSSDHSSTIVVGKETPAVAVSGQVAPSNNGNNAHDVLTFSAVVTPQSPGDPNPTGSISWTITGGSCTSTSALSADRRATTSTATCTIDPSSSSVTYTANAQYSGDQVYNGNSGSATSPG